MNLKLYFIPCFRQCLWNYNSDILVQIVYAQIRLDDIVNDLEDFYYEFVISCDIIIVKFDNNCEINHTEVTKFGYLCFLN